MIILDFGMLGGWLWHGLGMVWGKVFDVLGWFLKVSEVIWRALEAKVEL